MSLLAKQAFSEAEALREVRRKNCSIALYTTEKAPKVTFLVTRISSLDRLLHVLKIHKVYLTDFRKHRSESFSCDLYYTYKINKKIEEVLAECSCYK